MTELREAIRCFIETHNTHAAKPFRWTKSALDILDAVDRTRNALRKETSRTGHQFRIRMSRRRRVGSGHLLSVAARRRKDVELVHVALTRAGSTLAGSPVHLAGIVLVIVRRRASDDVFGMLVSVRRKTRKLLILRGVTVYF